MRPPSQGLRTTQRDLAELNRILRRVQLDKAFPAAEKTTLETYLKGAITIMLNAERAVLPPSSNGPVDGGEDSADGRSRFRGTTTKEKKKNGKARAA